MINSIRIPGSNTHRRGYGAGGTRKTLDDLAQSVYISVGQNTRFREFQRTYRDDRVAFVYDCLPRLGPTFALYQEEILANYDMGIRRQALRGPHGLGKTILAAIIVHHTMLTTEEDAIVPTLASVWRQLEKFLWPEIHKIAKFLDWRVIGRDPYTRDELMTYSMRLDGPYGPSEAFAVASGEAALIEGAHATRLFYIFDESKSVADQMWDAAEGAFSTEGAVVLTSREAHLAGECFWLAISTPGEPRGRFYEIHSGKEGLEDWHVRYVTTEEAIAAGRIGAQWVETRKRQWGENSAIYKNRVLGQFASDSSEGVIPSDWIDLAFERWDEWDALGRPGEGLGRRVIGVDAARYGDDNTVFADRVGNRIEEYHIYAKQSIPVSAGYLKPLAKTAHNTIIEMDSGLGASIYDLLNQENNSWKPTMQLTPVTVSSGTSKMDSTNVFRFDSVRAAAWWNMRELLDPSNNHQIALKPDPALLGDLSAPRYEIKYKDGYLTICLESKDSIKKKERLGRSPDRGDAVVLAFWDDAESSGGSGVVV